ncbi:MAG: hypothetical protein AB7T63_10485 [Planctomycetota bacterium]
MRTFLSTLLALVSLLGAAGLASAKEPAPLRGRPIEDQPTTVSVALNEHFSWVLPLPQRFWHMAPRHSPHFATSLAGNGLILQYLNDIGGSVAMLYVGAVPLPPAEPDEAPRDRAQRAATDFARTLGASYQRVGWTISSGDVALMPASFKLMGKQVAGWRTKDYVSRPEDYQGPESVFQGACVLFQPPGAEVLCYAALDFKAGGTRLDVAIAKMDVKRTQGLNAQGRRVQLNDLVESAEGRYPVRLLAFDMPPRFVPTPAIAKLPGVWVYAEERLPERGGWPDAILKIEGVTLPKGQSVREYAQGRKSALGGDRDAHLEEVPLAVEGHKGYLFAHPAVGEPPGVKAHSAVVLLDDQLLTFTWVTRGDARLAAADHDGLVKLLRSVQMAVRW